MSTVSPVDAARGSPLAESTATNAQVRDPGAWQKKRKRFEENRRASIGGRHPTLESAHDKLAEYYISEKDDAKDAKRFRDSLYTGHKLDGVALLKPIDGDLSEQERGDRECSHRMVVAALDAHKRFREERADEYQKLKDEQDRTAGRPLDSEATRKRRKAAAGGGVAQAKDALVLSFAQPWDGRLVKEAAHDGAKSSFLSPAACAEAIHRAPSALNKAGIAALYEVQPKLPGTGARGSHLRRGAIPSSQSVGATERLINKEAEATLAAQEAELAASLSSSTPEERAAVGDDSVLKHFWCVKSVRAFIMVLLRAFKVYDINSVSEEFPYMIKIVNDGAPTTKLRGARARVPRARRVRMDVTWMM